MPDVQRGAPARGRGVAGPGAARQGGVAPQTLTVADVAIGKVKPYPRNPRRNEAAVAKVAASIRAFGFRQPIVCDASMTVIAGHTRLLAARSLGLTSVPVHVARGLTPAQVRAYRLADNRTAQEATWDNDALVEELLALRADAFDLPLTGFDAAELDALLAPAAPALEPGDAREPDYRIVVFCEGEAHQAATCATLEGQGLRCQLLTL